MVTRDNSNSTGAEKRLKELGIKLPAPPEPFGTYAEAVQTGNLLFLTGMLPTKGRVAKFIGRVGAELDVVALPICVAAKSYRRLPKAERDAEQLELVHIEIMRAGCSKSRGFGRLFFGQDSQNFKG